MVDRKRLNWLNSQHLRKAFPSADPAATPPPLTSADASRLRQYVFDMVMPLVEAELEARGASPDVLSSFSDDYVEAVFRLQHERVSALPEFVDLVLPFFMDPDFEAQAARDFRDEFWRDFTPQLLAEVLSAVGDTTEGAASFAPAVMASIKAVAKQHKLSPKHVMLPVRYALTAMPVGPVRCAAVGVAVSRRAVRSLTVAF